MKQTAVEWLEKELNLIEENKYTSYIELKIKQAKAMEKQQILYAYECGFFDPQSNKDLIPLEGSEQYYNETYESNN
jgi:hypothetical protein